MSQGFSGRAASSTGPAIGIAAVTPADDADLPGGPCRSLYVGGAGTLRIIAIDGREATLQSGPCQYHPIQARRVMTSGTTATGVVALY